MGNRTRMPERGTLVEVTARRCSERTRPLVKVGERYAVAGSSRLKDGTPVLLLSHPTRKGATLRLNARRFGWRAITREDIREERFREAVRRDAERLKRTLTEAERLSIAIVPVIGNGMAWAYAMKAAGKAAGYRVEALKRVTRAVRALRQDYEREMAKDISRDDLAAIERETDRFMACHERDFTILYFSVYAEVKRKMPSYPYDDLRAMAIIARLMIRLVDGHNRWADELIASRVGHGGRTTRMAAMTALDRCMEAYAGDPLGKFDYKSRDVTLSMRVIMNDLRKTDFNIR